MSNNETKENKPKKDNSMFMYTALIFVAAIIIVILAFFSQTHLEQAQPSASTEATALPETGNDLQGIAKSAAELSDKNLELLEENRDLNKRLDDTEAEIDAYDTLLEAYALEKADDDANALEKLNALDYNSLSDDAKKLYDDIKTQLQ